MEKPMSEIEAGIQGGGAQVAMAGAWPPGRAAELKLRLEEALRTGGGVTVHLADAETVSAACMQLLLAARKSAQARQIDIRFPGPFRPEVARVAESLGLPSDAAH